MFRGCNAKLNSRENDKMRISYGMWKSDGSVSHKALHQVYEQDKGNPRTYVEIFSISNNGR